MLSPWMRFALLVSGLVVLIVALTMTSLGLLDHYIEKRTQGTSFHVASSIDLLINDHVGTLEVLAEIGGEHVFLYHQDLLAATVKKYPHFYAINWLDSDGVVRRVFPLERNQAALKKNLFTVPLIRQRLEVSQRELKPVMVPRVRTFQGIDAATFYIPIVKDGVLQGWVNAVLDVDSLIQSYLREQPFEEGLSLQLQSVNDPSLIYRFGDVRNVDPKRSFPARILGEPFRISVNFNDVSQWEKRRWIGWSLFAASLLLVGLFILLVRGLKISVEELSVLNERLAIKNAMISSLAHDLGTPLTRVMVAMDLLERGLGDQKSLWLRTRGSLSTLRSMMDSVKYMHALELGQASLRLQPVVLAKAIAEALELVQAQVEAKGLRLKVFPVAPDLAVRADDVTLTNNVLPNLFTNAVKFSATRGLISIRVLEVLDDVMLEIEDEGVGISSRDLADFFDQGKIVSRSGTSGEAGSGLGMLQVKTFMDLYRGQVRISSRTEGVHTGTKVTLIFRRADLGKVGDE